MCGHDAPPLANGRPAQCAGAGTNPNAESGASVLRLSPDLGSAALRGGAGRQQEAHLAADARARDARTGQSPAEGDSDANAEQAPADGAESVVGH